MFRANVGQAWAGDVKRLPDGSLLIRNPRPFSSGLPKGFSDLFGLVSVEVTPEMVGSKLAVFTALEIKTPTGRVSGEQAAFLRAVKMNGGRAGVVRNEDDAARVIAGEDLQETESRITRSE